MAPSSRTEEVPEHPFDFSSSSTSQDNTPQPAALSLATIACSFNPTTVRSLSLEGLPVELLKSIADFLPTSSAAILTTTSRALLSNIGPTYLMKIKAGKWNIPRRLVYYGCRPLMTRPQKELENFWLLLEDEYHDVIYCYHCKRIHTPDVTKPSLNEEDPPTGCSDVEVWTIDCPYVHSDFNFSQVQMVMKRHRLNLDTSSHLQALSKTQTWYNSKPVSRHTRQLSTTACIHDGRFMMQTQHRMLIPFFPVAKIPNFWSLKLCPHIQSLGASSGSETHDRTFLDRRLTCRLSHPEILILRPKNLQRRLPILKMRHRVQNLGLL